MAIIESSINTGSESFAANAEWMSEKVKEFQAIEQLVVDTAGKKREALAKLDKLLPRERLHCLLDPGAPFIELSSLVGYKMYDDKDGSSAGGGFIAGIGYVSGVRCLVQVNNYSVKGGTFSPIGLEKTIRAQKIALENKLPIINLLESGGANLNYATESFVRGANGFANQARLSAAGIPQITVVHGNATAGGAYQAGLSDYMILVRNKSKIFLAGPPLLKAATGEIADDEELGGADMHAAVAGTGEYLAENDADGIRIAREVVGTLNWEPLPKSQKSFKEPLYNPDELMGIVPSDPKTPYDVKELIARIADGSDFMEFKPGFDQGTVCGHCRIQGQPVGVIGNNGPITPKGANKASQFIQLCEQSNTALLFLHNTTGFLVGTETEQNGVVKHGSKMIQAVANAQVPKISLVVGGSYGAGNYAMCGRGLDPHFIFAWPSARTAIMGGEQAGMVLRIVAEEKARKAGVEPDKQQLEQMEQSTADFLNQSATALFGTARLWDDGLIDPRDSRQLLGFLLDICREGEQRQIRSITFGAARF
ncbi:acyl-CoA carboxylase subunit beta [Endozoicomonas arenosclerae]|uniref:acyl-CoA carboxylase subunit beta n=1 Tax=Endozoicomonas arenosclerae TaxID=1633495 RepID=UPI0007814D64|nr:acyl-CoA carboxylase subunit beta [Endozoicomonas arenosclerae]